MRIRFRLSDKDRERYGGDEWVVFDDSQLADLGYDRLAELERDIKRHEDSSIMRIAVVEWPRLSMLGFRGLSWIARQLAGFEKPAWTDFKPDVLGMNFNVLAGDDADPPAGGSSEPPSADSAKMAKANTARPKKGSRF